MKNFSQLILVTSIFCSTHTQGNENDWNYSVGLSVKQTSLDVFNKGESDPQGILTGSFLITPEFGVDSNIAYFSDGNWGYKYVMNYGWFKMTTQEVNLEDVDLNTSARGYYLYAMPVGVYEFLKGKKNTSMLAGFGLGLGYLKAKGDIIFTETTPQLKHEFSLSELTYSFGLFFEYARDEWSYKISLYGPEVNDSDYEYNLFDFGLTARKKLLF